MARLDDHHLALGIAQEAVADTLLFQVGDHPGAEERTLADAALAMQDEDPSIGPVEGRGEPHDVGVAAGEQQPVGVIVVS